MVANTFCKPEILQKQIVKINETYYVSLPKSWCVANGILAGSILPMVIEHFQIRVLAITPTDETEMLLPKAMGDAYVCNHCGSVYNAGKLIPCAYSLNDYRRAGFREDTCEQCLQKIDESEARNDH